MRKKNGVPIILLAFLLAGFQTAAGAEKTGDFPVLKGPYLGQKPPGMEPEVFAPGIISTEKTELNSVFSPQGDEFFFAVYSKPGETCVIMYTKQFNGTWSKPEIAPFSGQYIDVDMAFSPDGNRLYFCSKRPVPGNAGNSTPKHNIWFCRRLRDNGWSEPGNPGAPVNSPASDTYPSFTKNGTMYFASSREGGKGGKDVYYAKFVRGKFSEPVNLGETINTQYGEGDTFIAPDESFLIVSSRGRPGCRGRGDLYISFKKKDGTWTPAVNMGKPVNTDVIEFCPMVSPDGKYLFFTRKGDIYWVDARIITKFKIKAFKQVLKTP